MKTKKKVFTIFLCDFSRSFSCWPNEMSENWFGFLQNFYAGSSRNHWQAAKCLMARIAWFGQPCTRQKFFEKFLWKGLQLCFEISLSSFIPQIFEQIFYQSVTVYLVRVWTYKNADEKVRAFFWRRKQCSKTDKNCILCKSALKRLLPITRIFKRKYAWCLFQCKSKKKEKRRNACSQMMSIFLQRKYTWSVKAA